MLFTDVGFPENITTGYEDPVNDFFVPLLKASKKFDVAVGYFTSGWLKDTAEGMAEFALGGGISRWVVSPELQEEDAVSISEPKTISNTLENLYEKNLFEMISSLRIETRQELCALVAAGVLQFQIAIPKAGGGMLHAKLGIAEDENGDLLAFSGSYNFTSAAKTNWERIDIFQGWEDANINRVKNIVTRFESLWENSDPSYEVMKPSIELINLIKREAGSQIDAYIAASKKSESLMPVQLRPYQLEAIAAWGKNNCRGSFIMATGSGKTITALAATKKLLEIISEKEKPLVIVVILPLKHLLDQWFEEAMDFGFKPIKCYENSNTWRKKLAERIGVLKVVGTGHVMAMVTNATFIMDIFQQEIRRINTEFLIIADEAHNLGSDTYLKALPENANFRLALSATPDRYNDPSGTVALFDYFGPPVINFSLEDAINNQFLCPYEYFPHICLMSEAEYEEYLDISRLIKKETELNDQSGEKTKEYKRLIGKRADLITGVESKLEILELSLKKQAAAEGVSHTLIYCGSRKGEDELRHIERTVKLIGSLGIKTRKFTADESLEERREILKLFANGDLESIAAIKCLDEGVDVPATRVAYILASTANPREFIQRRGRVLRKSHGKEKAIIHDFLVAPPYRRNEEDDMVERELERAVEFSRLSLNKNENSKILRELAEKFGVTL